MPTKPHINNKRDAPRTDDGSDSPTRIRSHTRPEILHNDLFVLGTQRGPFVLRRTCRQLHNGNNDVFHQYFYRYHSGMTVGKFSVDCCIVILRVSFCSQQDDSHQSAETCSIEPIYSHETEMTRSHRISSYSKMSYQ